MNEGRKEGRTSSDGKIVSTDNIQRSLTISYFKKRFYCISTHNAVLIPNFQNTTIITNHFFQESSHIFISPHFCIKFITMSSNFAVITQDEFEETLIPNPRVTMALPHLAPMLVAKVSKKELIQKGLWGRVPREKPKKTTIEIPSHNCGSHQVGAHQCTVTNNSNGNKKKDKVIKSKKKSEKTKHHAYPKTKDDCKESVKLAHSLHIKELRDLVNSFKK